MGGEHGRRGKVMAEPASEAPSHPGRQEAQYSNSYVCRAHECLLPLFCRAACKRLPGSLPSSHAWHSTSTHVKEAKLESQHRGGFALQGFCHYHWTSAKSLLRARSPWLSQTTRYSDVNPEHVTCALSISSDGDLHSTCVARGARLAYLPLRCGWSGQWQTSSAAGLCPGRCTRGGPGHGLGSRAAAQGSGQGIQLPLSRTERCHWSHLRTPPSKAGLRASPRLCLLFTRAKSGVLENKNKPDTAPIAGCACPRASQVGLMLSVASGSLMSPNVWLN